MFVKKISINNYKCFQKPTEIEFYDKKIIAIVGQNSTGKTSLLESIRDSYYLPPVAHSVVIKPEEPHYVIYCNFNENILYIFNNIAKQNEVLENKAWGVFTLENKDLSLINLQCADWPDLTKLKRNNCRIPYDNLSSGEKSYISLIRLLKHYAHLNTLFLLDEPDAAINPSLKRKYINLFEKYIEMNNSQIIFTTHSCDLLGDLQETQVYLCSDGKIENIDFNPFGLSKEVIKRKLFKSESSVSEKTENKFKEINNKIKQLKQDEKNIYTLEKIENEISQTFADSPLKDELFKKLDNLKRG